MVLIILFLVSPAWAQTVISDMTVTKCSGSGSCSANRLPKTGQTTNYRAGDDETYNDPAGGFDAGKPQAEGTWSNYWTDGHRFTSTTIGSDKVVTDNATGLMWAADGTAAGCFSGGTQNWNAAIDWAEALTFATYSDWRLPNELELASIMLFESAAITSVKAAGAPYINQTVFPNTVSGIYWSSTTYASTTTYGLSANFSAPAFNSFDKTTASYYTRAVRGGY
jgi:hypothetical protein